ncbi:MAG: MATE family efflux transporter [Paracoccaceae bacterium]
MENAPSPKSHLRAILILGLPLVGSHVAQFSINLVDAVMLGWYGVDELAAEVLAGTMFFVLFIVGSGFAFAVMPMVAKAEAAGDLQRVRRVTRMGMWLATGFGLLAMPVFLFATPILIALGQNPDIAELAGQYLTIIGWSIFPALLVMVLKSYLAALERTRVVLLITLAGLALNAVLNYALIFGNWGAPEMGIRGAAITSLLGALFSLVLLVWYVMRVTPEHAMFQRIWRPDWQAIGAVFRLGWPIGITNLAEVGLFAASSVMMGWLGTVPLAAHGIAMQIASMTFMVHLGLSNAATIRAGQALGRQDAFGLKRGARVVIALSLALSLLMAATFLLAPQTLIGAFLSPDDPARSAVIALGTGLLAAAALFQLVDAAQVIALGLLRGVQDTRIPMLIAGLSYWGIGLTSAYILGFVLDWQGIGVWIGLAIGLTAAAVLMMWRFWSVAVKQIPAT